MTTQNGANPTKAEIWASLDADEAKGITPQPDRTANPDAGKQVATDPAGQQQDAAALAATAASAGHQQDLYAGLPHELRDEIVGLKTMLSQTATRLRNTEGHIGGLNSQIKELTTAARAAAKTDGDAPSAAALRAAQGDASAMAKLKEDYPEFGAALDKALDERLGGITSQLAQVRQVGANTDRQADTATRAELDSMRREIAVERTHPGWQETVKTPAFAGWLQGQPREVQMLAASESPQDAVRLLDLHQEARQAGAGKTTQRLDAAAAIPSGRSASSARAKPVEQMSKAEYWAYLDEQDALKQKAA